jgi:hypothetical protein
VLDNGNVGIGNLTTTLTTHKLLLRGGGAGIFRGESSGGTQRFAIDENGDIINNGSSFLIGGTSITTNAILDLQSTTKAFIPPRMTTAQRDAISSPSQGMVIYNTTTAKLNVYTTAWEAVTSA